MKIKVKREQPFLGHRGAPGSGELLAVGSGKDAGAGRVTEPRASHPALARRFFTAGTTWEAQ